MGLASGSMSAASLSGAGAGAADGYGDDLPAKTAHARHGSHGAAGPPRTFGSIGKWAQTEAAAKLKAANAAMSAGGVRRPVPSGADGPVDGSSGLAPSSSASRPPAAQ